MDEFAKEVWIAGATDQVLKCATFLWDPYVGGLRPHLSFLGLDRDGGRRISMS